MDPSDALSILKKLKPSLKGRTIGLLITDGADAGMVNDLRKAVEGSGATVKVIAEQIAGAELSDGSVLKADQRFEGGPSSLFDAVGIVASNEGAERIAGMGAAQDFLRDAFAHLKAVGYSPNLSELFAKSGLGDADLDDACVLLAKRRDPANFINIAAQGKHWPREPKVRPKP